MTLRMLDSITPGNLPAGADAYLGYVDGAWPDFQAEVTRFPGAHVLGLTVFPSDDAEGCDCEKGDLTPAQVPGWTVRQIARGVWRPVQYASAFSIDTIMAGNLAAGIQRNQVRLLSAHYQAGKHICGPGSCGLTRWDCDGTQWSDTAPGLNGTLVDESILLDTFFGGTMSTTGPASWGADDWAKFWGQSDQHAVTLPYRDIMWHYFMWWLNQFLTGNTATIQPTWVGQQMDSGLTALNGVLEKAATVGAAAALAAQPAPPAAPAPVIDIPALAAAVAAELIPLIGRQVALELGKVLTTA